MSLRVRTWPSRGRAGVRPLELAVALLLLAGRVGAEEWAPDGNPWRVSGDLVVPEGEELLVRPGAVVSLEAGASIVVRGALVARGTAEIPVVFRGAETAGGPARWGSIVFEDGSLDAEFDALDDYRSGSILEHCVVEQGTNAVRLLAASPFVRACTFRDNRPAQSMDLAGGGALQILDGSAPRVRGNTFEDNGSNTVTYGGAVYVRASDAILQGNTFDGNRAVYGGALTVDLHAGPIVGNSFTANEATLAKGGAISLISSCGALIGNVVAGNGAALDGGGIHVCVDCYPHAAPHLLDNVVTGNTSAASEPGEGAAGVGAAYLRTFDRNDVHGNLRVGEPSDLGWFHQLEEGYPDWVANPRLGGTFWGTTDGAEIAATIHDGRDDPDFGVVAWEPAASQPWGGEGPPRAVVSTRKLRYVDAGEPMPVFLTVYNPGPARRVELAVVLTWGDRQSLLWRGPLAFPGAVEVDGLLLLDLPEDWVFFATLLTAELPSRVAAEARWTAVLFDPDSGSSLGPASEARFELRPGGGS